MSLFGWLMTAANDNRDPLDERWWNGGQQMLTASGIRVTEETALTAAAVYACVRVVAEDSSMLPLPLYVRMGGGGKERAQAEPLYRLINDQPNPWQTSSEWREMQHEHLELRGNAYNQIVPNRRGELDRLVPLHPDRMTIERLPDMSLRYKYQPPADWDPRGGTWTFEQDEILHFRGFGSDGIKGKSTLSYAAQLIGESIAAREFSSRLFSQGGKPPVVLKHPKTLSDNAAKRIRREWHEAHSGLQNAHRAAVLEEGMEAQELGFSMEDVQLIALRTFTQRQISAFFRVTPHMLQDLDRTTFNNVEHLGMSHVKHTLMPRLRRFEQRLNASLLEDDSPFYFEHLVEGLMRGDLMTRYQAFAIGRRWGWLSVNDIREIENMNPVDGGDEYIEPGNYQPIGGEPTDTTTNQNGTNGTSSMVPDLIISGNGANHE